MSKRKASSLNHAVSKRRKLHSPDSPILDASVRVLQPLLNHRYPRVQSLQDYLLHALPASSRVRRKRLLAFIQSPENASFFTTTLVGLPQKAELDTDNRRLEHLSHFTHSLRPDAGLTATAQYLSIDEVIDFVVWALFKECHITLKKPNHILCHGLDRSVATHMPGVDKFKPLLPGIIQRYPNPCRNELSKPVWRQLLTHLGTDGQRILSDLFIDCGLFVTLHHGTANLGQLSGIPIHDLGSKKGPHGLPAGVETAVARKPSAIKFVRSRILYAKASQTHKGHVCFGFRHMHLLNRLSATGNRNQDVNLMMYVFPRQFQLHNVFTSPVDQKETTQLFKDYTARDQEISAVPLRQRSHVPRRLRGQIRHLISKLRKLHQHCSYHQTLYHYCPLPHDNVPSSSSMNMRLRDTFDDAQDFRTQLVSSSMTSAPPEYDIMRPDHVENSFLPYITSTDRVSSFCRSILSKLILPSLFGTADAGRENWRRLLGHVDRFVSMRKFETLNLHEVCQGLKIKDIPWLAPPGVDPSQRVSISDLRKREEIFHELIYYLFDSLLIPLLSSNFYITESGVHRNRLLFFRHDVWERLCRPTLASSRLGALVPLTKSQVRLAKSPAGLWYSVVRFLPKDVGTRPIANLRRRAVNMINARPFLAQSVNARLAPIFNIFNYERHHDTGIFQSDSFSMKAIGDRLSAFKLQTPEALQTPLYFVKVDIQSAFDSIPHEELLTIVNGIFKHDHYCVTRHAESKHGADVQSVSRFVKSARPMGYPGDALDLPAVVVANKKHVVFSDVDCHQVLSSDSAKRVLRQHVQSNTVKIGKEFYRKSEGIAQGSVLSSLLCTFFYNHFERNKLGFLDPKRSTILRIMDDFLLVTMKKSDALRFMMAMKAGDSDYGIRVHPEKSLVNFNMAVDGVQIPMLAESSFFPFCGLFIDTKTLQVSKNRVRKDNIIANSLTVDIHGQVGAKFKRRVLSSLRIQLQNILLRQGLNDKMRITRTLVESIQETAMKMHQYYISMPVAKRPSPGFLKSLIQRLMDVSSRTISEVSEGPRMFTRSQLRCLVAAGMLRVLYTRHSHYLTTLKWLEGVKVELLHTLEIDQHDLDKLVDSCFESVRHYRF